MVGQDSHGQHRTPLHAVIDSLHAAYRDAATWNAFLSCLSDAVGARVAVIVSLAPVERTGLIITHGISREAIKGWQTRHQENDPWLSSLSMPDPGNVVTYRGSELIQSADFAPEFVDHFMQPNGLGHHAGAWINPAAPLSSPYALLLWRGPDEADFSEAELNTIGLAARSMATQEAISIANALSRADGLANQQSAAYLLNANGAVLMTNRRGAELIDCELVRHQGHCLGFASGTASAWIQGLLASAERIPDTISGPVEQRERMAGLGVVNMSFYPLAAIGAAPSLLGVRFGLTLREADAKAAVNLARVASRMYRWTSAELDTVRRLADGYTVPDIARERQCSVETVRSHLKNAKRKAGVNRQVELVRVMISLEASGN